MVALYLCLHYIFTYIVFVLALMKGNSVPRLGDKPPSHIKVDGQCYCKKVIALGS